MNGLYAVFVIGYGPCLRYARQRFPGWLKGIDKWGIMEKINE
jgi:hypothetical protein